MKPHSETPPPGSPPDDHPNVIARPPLLFLAALLWAIITHGFITLRFHMGDAPFYLGVAFMAAGAILIAAAITELHAAKTGVDPMKPVTALVTGGVYRYSRNPIYIGLSLLYFGIGGVLDMPWILVYFLPLLWFLHNGVILREEAFMEGKFGQEYREYKQRVKRWF